MATGGASPSTVLRTARNVYQTEGVGELLRTGLEYAISRPRVHPRVHWWLASAYYRRRCVNDVAGYDPPVDPFRLEWVSPDSIRRHTRREYPPYRGRLDLFGAVQSGDWDVRETPPVDSTYDGPPASLFVDETFEDSVLYRSFAAHFEDGVPWEETELVREALRLVSEPTPERVWHECETEAEVRRRCRLLDDLFASVEREGYHSQRQRLGRDPSVGFRHCLRHEITVDVGRNGELLLVCGKHRLALAKLLDLERVPVVFLVRHESWMDRRATLARQGRRLDHPDVPARAGAHS
jgi:hypothetical protein